MNQGRIWTVVSPSVGLPLIIGGAAVTALIVHGAVLTHTTWFGAYWQGASKAKVAESYAPAVSQLNVTPVQNASGSTSFVVSLATPDSK